MSETITITDLNYMGAGVGRLANGQVCFVEQTCPGDIIEVTAVKTNKHYAQATIWQLHTAAPDRHTPVCSIFGKCGGCSWQHIVVEKQRQSKVAHLYQQFLKAGLLQNPALSIAPLIYGEAFHYRSRIQLQLNNGQAGFVAKQSQSIVPVDLCWLIGKKMNNAIANLPKKLLTQAQKHGLTKFELRHDERDHIDIFWPQAHLKDNGRAFVLDCLAVDGIDGASTPQQQQGDSLFHFSPQPHLTLTASPGVFTQVNLALNRQLVTWVLQQLDFSQIQQVFDLYAGMGNLALSLANQHRQTNIIAFESNKAAIRDGMNNQTRLPNPNNMQWITSIDSQWDTSFKKLPQPDLVILDPPRVGAKAILPNLIRQRPKDIIYISCHPATLVRDLGYLTASGWQCMSIQPFDFFPQTPHLEIAVHLSFKHV